MAFFSPNYIIYSAICRFITRNCKIQTNNSDIFLRTGSFRCIHFLQLWLFPPQNWTIYSADSFRTWIKTKTGNSSINQNCRKVITARKKSELPCNQITFFILWQKSASIHTSTCLLEFAKEMSLDQAKIFQSSHLFLLKKTTHWLTIITAQSHHLLHKSLQSQSLSLEFSTNPVFGLHLQWPIVLFSS